MTLNFTLFFYYFEKDTHTHLKLNPQWFSRNSKKWKKAIPDFYELENYASCFFMGYLYVFGGFLTDRKFKFSTDVCYVYDQIGEMFDEISHMLQYRNGHSCAVYRGGVVVTGGMEGTLNSVERYDPHLNLWSYMPDLCDEQRYHGSVAMGDKLFVIGRQSCEVFDVVSGKFTRITPLPMFFLPMPICLDAFHDAEIFRVKNEIIVKLGAAGTAKNKKGNKKKQKKTKNEVEK